MCLNVCIYGSNIKSCLFSKNIHVYVEGMFWAEEAFIPHWVPKHSSSVFSAGKLEMWWPIHYWVQRNTTDPFHAGRRSQELSLSGSRRLEDVRGVTSCPDTRGLLGVWLRPITLSQLVEIWCCPSKGKSIKRLSFFSEQWSCPVFMLRCIIPLPTLPSVTSLPVFLLFTLPVWQ